MISSWVGLPRSDYVPTSAVGTWLVAAALGLIATDIVLCQFGNAQPDVVPAGALNELQLIDGVEATVRTKYEVSYEPIGVGLARVAVPFVAMLILVGAGRISREDVGLTFGSRRIILFWVFATALLICLLIVFVVVGVGFVHIVGLPLPQWVGQPIEMHASWTSANFWRAIAWACLVVPLYEDTVYKGFLVPALERLGGFWLAIAGSGALWACLHAFYGRPIAWAPMYLASGMFGAWLFLNARSLVPLYMLHGLWNAVPFGHDLCVLGFPSGANG